MASIDALQQLEDRHTARSGRTGRSLGLKLLLAEYRRAVAAEEFYDQLRCASATFSRKVPRSEIARVVFEQLYHGQK
jgi:hypothetical protein